MPRKLRTNPKAEAARERKAEVAKAKKSAAEQAAEAARWADEGSTAAERRKQEKAAREAEEARKRAEKKALLAKEEAEAAAINMRAKNLSNAEKITRAQLLRQQEEAEAARQAEAERLRLEKLKLAPQPELEANPNRAASDEKAAAVAQFGEGNVIFASGMDSALSAVAGGALSSGKSSSSDPSAVAIDRRPEKRMKSAYVEFEEKTIPQLRQEHPRLKLSQYKEMCFKLWQKDPTNPFNIRKAQEQSLLQQTDEWKYGNFREE